LAAIDFAPPSMTNECNVSDRWVTAMAAGLVVRSANGVVVVDLDGDGKEQTGWDIMYLHIANDGRVAVGTYVNANDHIGHPSCEGGVATGTHVHIARKYNGEWIPAAGYLPFDLNGWVVQGGDQAYKGTMIKDGQIVTACSCSSSETDISRP
jgi:murein DD-endopeptidase MepM/ murein hydrolase activator NlpD